MLLSARILVDVASANVFRHAEAAQFTEGDGPTVYFQLLDKSLDRADEGFNPTGRRYMPAAGATLQVTIGGIDTAKTVIRSATQPFPLDPSIWAVTLMSTDPLKGTYDLKLALTEGSRVTRGVLSAALRIQPQNSSYC